MDTKFLLAVLVALFLDVTDWFVVGLIPIAGDILDLAGIAVLFFLVGPASFIGLIELIPVLGDLSPSFLVAVFASRTSLFTRKGGKGES